MSKFASVVALSAFSVASAFASAATAGGYGQGSTPVFDIGLGHTFVTQGEMVGMREGRSAARTVTADGSTSFDLTPGSTFLTQGQILGAR